MLIWFGGASAFSALPPTLGHSTYHILMARFSANLTDSSDEDDELELTVPQPPPPQKEQKRFRPPISPVRDEEESGSDEDALSSESSSSEMQEDELLASPPRKTPAMTRNALIEDEDGEIRYAHEVNNRTPQPRKSPPRQRGDPTIIPWAQQVGVDAQKMHVMQTSLFRMPEEAAAMRALSKPTLSSKARLQILQPINRKHSRESDGDTHRIDPREVRAWRFFHLGFKAHTT